MAKWADYGISAVRFNAARTHIDRVRAHPDNGESIGAGAEYTRQDVVAAIKNGTTFVTIFKTSAGKLNKGESVYIVRINGTEYIKTVADGQAKDNLDNLPEF